MSRENWNRSYIMKIGKKGSNGFEIGNIGQSKDALHISFSIEKCDTETANNGKIQIWNLSDANLKLLDLKDLIVELRAGYGNTLNLVTVGDVTAVTTTMDKADRMTELEVVDGRVPVFGAGTAHTLDECLGFVRELTEFGAGCMVNIPYENDVQYREYIRAIDAQNPSCLMVQDYDLLGPGVPAELLAALYDEIESYQCLKIETQLPGPKMTKMLRATENRLHISGGWCITQYIEALDRGVHGMVPTGMNEIFCKLDRLYRNGSREKANRLFLAVQPVIAFANQQSTLSLYFYKRLLWKQGFYQTPKIRTAGLDFDDYFIRIADEQIDRALALISEVKAGKYD